MGLFTVGDVVSLPFPYSDLSKFKKRPALVVGQAEFNNLILCQITSRPETSKRSVIIDETDFASGGLPLNSFARPDKLFTVEKSVIDAKLGSLKSSKTQSVRKHIAQLFV